MAFMSDEEARRFDAKWFKNDCRFNIKRLASRTTAPQADSTGVFLNTVSHRYQRSLFQKNRSVFDGTLETLYFLEMTQASVLAGNSRSARLSGADFKSSTSPAEVTGLGDEGARFFLTPVSLLLSFI